MATKNQPGKFDCYANAELDEPYFVLLARDACAADVIGVWCNLRVQRGKNKFDDEQIQEAIQCGAAMQQWRAQKRNKHAVEVTDEELELLIKHREAKA